MPVDRIALPAPPAPPPPWRLPIVAILAPVAIAAVAWTLTRSPLTLLFAALGPVTAIASLVDQSWWGRRSRRRERARFELELDTARADVARAHAMIRSAIEEAAPSGAQIVAEQVDRGRWIDPTWTVALGRAQVPSGLELVRAPGGDSREHAALDDVEALAAVLDAPLRVDARLGVGVAGPGEPARAWLRDLVVQLLRGLPPDQAELRIRGTGEAWIDDAPHASRRRAGDAAGFEVEIEWNGETTRLAAAANASDLPPECRVVLALTGAGARVESHPDRESRVPIVPSFVSTRDASRWSQRAGADPRARRARAVPLEVELGGLLEVGAAEGSGLECVVGRDGDGLVAVDLVRDGPHAIIAGTTGSGKSELLVSWVLAMAAHRPPDRVTFLLVDFKGGAAFAPLAELPHVVGTVTDLDEDAAARALDSLRAELRFRERRIAEVGGRNSDDAGLARLVIVVDEFAAMLAEFPDLHALFSDLAARGRSLGLHLVLCTQRPAGVVRDGLLANADLRICLRVNNRADSEALVGTPAAAEIAAAHRGRAVLRAAGGDTREVQLARADPAIVASIRGRWEGAPAPRRPWCDPLPSLVATESLPAGAFGLVDLPHEQRRDVARWDPLREGSVLVLGAPRSGRSTAIAALGGIPVPGDPARAWDAIDDAVRDLDSGDDRRRILAIDDLDALTARFGPEHRAEWLERLARVLREGPARGIHVLSSAQRPGGELSSIAALFPAVLRLRHASRQDWLLSGGDPNQLLGPGHPGAGRWHGERVQVAGAAVPTQEPPPLRGLRVRAGVPLALASPRPATAARWAADRGWRIVPLESRPNIAAGDGEAIVGHVDEWQSHWGALARARESCTVMLEGCTLAEVRQLTRSRELPPPLPAGGGFAWSWLDDGRVVRCAWPAPTTRPAAVSSETMESEDIPRLQH